jgi:hypothetical protein
MLIKDLSVWAGISNMSHILLTSDSQETFAATTLGPLVLVYRALLLRVTRSRLTGSTYCPATVRKYEAH